MKRISVTFMALACVATMALAETNETTSANIVGYQTFTVPGDGATTPIGVSYDKIGATALDSSISLLDLVDPSQLIAANPSNFDSYSAGDQFYVWNGVDYDYYINTANGVMTAGMYDSAMMSGIMTTTNVVLAAGESFYIESARNSGDRDLVLQGQVVNVASQVKTISAGSQMLSFPFSSSVSLDDASFFLNDSPNEKSIDDFPSPGDCDQLFIWDYATRLWVDYSFRDGGWYKASQFYSEPASSFVVDMGTPMYFVTQGVGFEYAQELPYADVFK